LLPTARVTRTAQTLVDRDADASWDARFDRLGVTGNDPDQVHVPKPLRAAP
jgi:hypothetical protein